MFVRNQWYVASWDHEIDRTPLARVICGEPIMLYRKFDRTVVALQDVCPHRLLPLSMGIKEGDNIRCRYHGLLINSEGQAIEMPVPTERAHKSICTQGLCRGRRLLPHQVRLPAGHRQGSVFLEDVAVLEAQQKSILANPELRLKAFSIDTGGVRARHVIDRMLTAHSAAPPA